MGYKNIEDRRAYHRAYYKTHGSEAQENAKLRQAAHRKRNKRKGGVSTEVLYARRLKDAVFGAYGGYVCACCGETEKMFMSLDHINNDGAVHRKAGLRGKQLHAWIIRNNFPPVFQVLCFNCNCGRAVNNGICPHKADTPSPESVPQGN